MKHKRTFLGVGWKFPPEFDRQNKSVTLVSEEQDISESLYILLSTRPGERVVQPDYGCDLSIINFETINESILNRAKEIIHSAVLKFEPRVFLDQVRISSQNFYDGVLEICLEYRIRRTNKRNNIVYPYYLLEGTEITNMPDSEQ